VAFALVDRTSGMTLTSAVAREFDIELAAAVATEVVRAKLRAIDQLGSGQAIQDILITLSGEMHLITLLGDERQAGLFSYLVLDGVHGDLALARRRLRELAGSGIPVSERGGQATPTRDGRAASRSVLGH
jgi:predicted regulator of Ras-like GTPase activity (Roadblock/LC7/MglB family)